MESRWGASWVAQGSHVCVPELGQSGGLWSTDVNRTAGGRVGRRMLCREWRAGGRLPKLLTWAASVQQDLARRWPAGSCVDLANWEGGGKTCLSLEHFALHSLLNDPGGNVF